jgi:hypothetical protein
MTAVNHYRVRSKRPEGRDLGTHPNTPDPQRGRGRVSHAQPARGPAGHSRARGQGTEGLGAPAASPHWQPRAARQNRPASPNSPTISHTGRGAAGITNRDRDPQPAAPPKVNALTTSTTPRLGPPRLQRPLRRMRHPAWTDPFSKRGGGRRASPLQRGSA